MITRGVVKGSLGLHSPVGSSSAYSLRPRTHELTAYLSKPDHGSTVPSADHMSSNTLPPFLFCSPESRLLVCCATVRSQRSTAYPVPCALHFSLRLVHFVPRRPLRAQETPTRCSLWEEGAQ